MTLQTSGAISWANLQTEFGGGNPISLNEYIRTVGNSTESGGFNNYRFTPSMDGTDLKFGGQVWTNIVIQKHQKLVFDVKDANMTFSTNKLYFSSTSTPGNNNLITGGGVTNNALATDGLMVIDFNHNMFSGQHDPNGELVGYLKSDTNTNVTPVYCVSTPSTNFVQTHMAECLLSFDANFSGGDYNAQINTFSDIQTTENGPIIPAGGSAQFKINFPTGCSNGVWGGGTWCYLYMQLYDASYSAVNGAMTFTNSRNIGWTNNTAGTPPGGGSYMPNGGYSNDANGWAALTGHMFTGTPNYTGTSESVTASSSVSGSTWTGTLTNNNGNPILVNVFNSSQSGTSQKRPIYLSWVNAAGDWENSITGGASSTGEFNTNHQRTEYGYPSMVGLTYFYTPPGGTESNVGTYNHLLPNNATMTQLRDQIRSDSEAYFHDALDTGEEFPYVEYDNITNGLKVRYYKRGYLRIEINWLARGYSQVSVTSDNARTGATNTTIGTTAKGPTTDTASNLNIKRYQQNMSISHYYGGTGDF